MAKRLLLVRHAETGVAFKGCYVGSTDVPLGSRGPEQAGALRPLVQDYEPDCVVCSPLLRTRQTADILLEGSGRSAEIMDDLREVDFGRWEGLNFGQIAAADPELVDEWASGSLDFAFPEGDCLRDFHDRVVRVGQQLADFSEETVLVVTHGGVIRAMICHFLGLPVRDYILFDVQPATVTVLDLFDGKGLLAGLNLRSH